MRVTRLSAGCPAPVAPLPPQVSPRSATFSMARSVTFSMAIDNTEWTRIVGDPQRAGVPPPRSPPTHPPQPGAPPPPGPPPADRRHGIPPGDVAM